MPSVMQMTKSNPASVASMMAPAAKAGGTNMIDVLQSVSALASATELKTGTSSASWPPFPGVTPPTKWVPYSRI